MASWNGLDVVVLGAMIDGEPAQDRLMDANWLDNEIQVHISFPTAGPPAEDDPPWGPQGEAVVSLADLSGPVSYCYGRERLTIILREARCEHDRPQASGPSCCVSALAHSVSDAWA